MKRALAFIGIILSTASLWADEPPVPKVHSMKDPRISGVYWAASGGGNKSGDTPPSPPRLVYIVDTKAQLCYAQFTWGIEGKLAELALTPISINPVPCQQLKKRAEWKDLINW